MSEMCSDNVAHHLCKFIGETVTIFTTSGGESGCGFTGIVIFVNDCFVRLVSCIGPAPSCALGNSCNGNFNSNSNDRCNNGNIRGVGSVTDIPISRIAAFVHNAT